MTLARVWSYVALAALLQASLTLAGCGYESCPETKPDMINVHLVPHTHDDVGWLKTVDEYYYGSRKSLSGVGVQYILDSVIPQLAADPSKRFIYVEMAFFWRWWQQQDTSMRQMVRRLVDSGQLEFINGGWSMNDEAATHYNAIIDQMTWGFKRLQDTFGQCGRPRVAWQIDPFGHSKEQASLFAQMGFDGLFFGRLDYEDKARRLSTKTMELVWKASDSLPGNSSWLFTGALFNGYGPPDGFCFDAYCDDDPIMDDPRLNGYNVPEKVADFLAAVHHQAAGFATNHIMMTMGSDFHYTNAISWFKNLDKLIRLVNQQQVNGSRVHLLYSTPSCYLYQLNKADREWSDKTDDFFPYASDPHAYWTGYFTSRPALKAMVRQGNNFLQICKQLQAVSWLQGHSQDDVTVMREEMGVLQHHDAITGTAKQAVTFDYMQRLAKAFDHCSNVISDAYQKMSGRPASRPQEQFCLTLNVSACSASETSDSFVVNVFNPLARPWSRYIRIPVPAPGYQVLDPDGDLMTVQAVPIPDPVLAIPGRTSKAMFELIFWATDLPPIGFKSYYVSKTGSKPQVRKQLSYGLRLSPKPRTLRTADNRQLVLNHKNRLVQVAASPLHIFDFEQNFGWYEGHPGNNSDFDLRASGAYIFRPLNDSATMLDGEVNTTVYHGPLVTELHQHFSPFISQVTRVFTNMSEVESEWLVGPIPVNDGVGKEIIVRYSTSISSNMTFFTDSNGRQMMKRVRDFRPTWNLNVTEAVSGNYYPVNSRIFIADHTNGDQLTILTDRSQGGSSLTDGEVELMIHRRLLFDDAFGVDEALNEQAFDQGLVVRGKHWIQISHAKNAARDHRISGEEKFMDALVSFVPTKLSFSEWQKSFPMTQSALTRQLPSNVHLLTLEQWDTQRILIRLEHQFEVREDPELSQDVTVSLADLFSSFRILSAQEMTLGGNMDLALLRRLHWRAGPQAVHEADGAAAPSPLVVTLSPMQIRTFLLTVRPNL